MTLLDELERLRADASAFARRVASARAGGRGVDRSGLVEIMLDGDGRPAKVRLRPGWRGAIGVGGLPVAVREAWFAAVLDRLAAWATAATDPAPAAGAPSDDAAPRRRAARGVTNRGGLSQAAPVRAGADGTVGGLMQPAASMRTDADGDFGGLTLPAAHLREVADGGAGGLTLSAALVGEVAGRDPGGRVVVEISRGELTALRVDEGWARVADEMEIEAAVLAALVDALGGGSADGAHVFGGGRRGQR
ncbi:hypothetical protein K1W54_37945 [Micromonospora sp. CPCC 205371]|nr:hypothetical protein [Micromonospora sp. CPCC 205371]